MDTRNPYRVTFKEAARIVRQSAVCPFKKLGLIAPDNPQDYRAQLLQLKKQNPRFRRLWQKAEDWARTEHLARVTAHAVYQTSPPEFKKQFPVSLINTRETRAQLYRELEFYSKCLPVGFGRDNLIS